MVFSATLTFKKQPNVGKYTIHGSYGISSRWLVLSSAINSITVAGTIKGVAPWSSRLLAKCALDTMVSMVNMAAGIQGCPKLGGWRFIGGLGVHWRVGGS